MGSHRKRSLPDNLFGRVLRTLGRGSPPMTCTVSATGSSYGTSTTRLASERGDRSLWGLGRVGVRLGGVAEGGEVALGVHCGRAPGAGGGGGLAEGVVRGGAARAPPRGRRAGGRRGDVDVTERA